MNRTAIPLLDASGATVNAWVHDAITALDLVEWETQWKPYLAKVKAALPLNAPAAPLESSHWDWRDKARRRIGSTSLGFTVFCGDELQGMMFVETTLHRCRLPAQKQKHLIYIEYLESAPWNQTALTNPAKYSGVGSALVLTAVELSRREGFKGRIGLLSLPQARTFYQKLGMTELGPENGHPRLSYFELSDQDARTLLANAPQQGGT